MKFATGTSTTITHGTGRVRGTLLHSRPLVLFGRFVLGGNIKERFLEVGSNFLESFRNFVLGGQLREELLGGSVRLGIGGIQLSIFDLCLFCKWDASCRWGVFTCVICSSWLEMFGRGELYLIAVASYHWIRVAVCAVYLSEEVADAKE